ncbi:hypothetical protein VNO77_40864 [Canavalia gladiata]|uniref:Uncharacterized protein n=1 Tax=Canavalia gladiata TaxID=3824 RepID=A0AAN9K133_CANGL
MLIDCSMDGNLHSLKLTLLREGPGFGSVTKQVLGMSEYDDNYRQRGREKGKVRDKITRIKPSHHHRPGSPLFKIKWNCWDLQRITSVGLSCLSYICETTSLPPKKKKMKRHHFRRSQVQDSVVNRFRKSRDLESLKKWAPGPFKYSGM